MPEQAVEKPDDRAVRLLDFRTRYFGFWARDEGLTVFFVNLLLLIFLIYPLGDAGILPGAPVRLIGHLIVITGVIAMASTLRTRLIFIAFAVGSTCLGEASIRFPYPPLVLASTVVGVGTLSIVGIVILKRVFAAGDITFHRIQGAVVVYMLLGLLCAAIYRCVSALDPNAFVVNGSLQPGSAQLSTFIYYSFTTLSTVGYGDIIPVNSFARSLAIFEAMSGQFYLAVLIGRLVSLSTFRSEQ